MDFRECFFLLILRFQSGIGGIFSFVCVFNRIWKFLANLMPYSHFKTPQQMSGSKNHREHAYFCYNHSVIIDVPSSSLIHN